MDWRRYGPKLAQVALTFGADDIDGISPLDDAPEGRRRAPRVEIDRNIQVAGFAPVPSGARTDGHTNTLAVSAFDVVNLGPRLQVNGGLRVERYDTDYRAVTVDGVVTSLTANDTLLSGKVGLLYQFSPIGNAYISYGSAATPPGSGNFALSTQPNNANNPNVDPQVSRNFEIGTKWELFNRRLAATLALFDTRNTNVIYTIDATAVPCPTQSCRPSGLPCNRSRPRATRPRSCG